MGPDALLAAVLVLAVAAIIVALRRTELLAKVAVPGALTLLAIAAIYVQTLDGAADGRDTLVSGWTFDGAMVTTAFIQAALTVAAGAGVWTLLGSARRDHRAIPADTLYSVAAAPLFVALIGLIVIPLLSSQGLFAMDDGRGDGGLFCLLPQALASLGGAAGGILAGLIYGALALLAIPAIALLLEVPTQAMEQRAGRTAATAAVALGALAIAAPFAVHGNWLPEVRLVAAALAAFASALLAIHLVTQRPDAQRLAAPKPQVRAVLALEVLLAAAVLAAATYAALATSGTVDPPEGLARILP